MKHVPVDEVGGYHLGASSVPSLVSSASKSMDIGEQGRGK